MPRTTKYAWTLKWYTDQGWRVGVVERTYKIGGRAQTFDLFTFGDMYGYGKGQHVIIQVTNDHDHAEHRTALLANPEVRDYLRDSRYNHVHLVSEHRRAKTKKGQVRIDKITLADFG